MASKRLFKHIIQSGLSKLRQTKAQPEAALQNSLSLQALTGLNSLETLPANPWRLETQLAPIYWTADDQAILTFHEGSKARCLLRIGSESDYRQSVLIAFDLETNQVLIDHPFPHTSKADIEEAQHITLHLNSPSGRMTLSLKLEGELNTPYESALVMTIISKQCHNDRRTQRRVYFDSELMPDAQINLPMRSGLKGRLQDLSEGGFCMKVYGPKDTSILRRQGDCILEIDSHFKLKCKVEIRDGRFTREPCAFTLIRVMFCHLSSAEQDRLRAFLIAMDDYYVPLNAA